jgi:hypothetical protein
MIRTVRAEWPAAFAAAAAALYLPLARTDDLAARAPGLALCIAPLLAGYVLRSWMVGILVAIACALLGGLPALAGVVALALVARFTGIARIAGAMAAIETIDRAARGIAQCVTYPPALASCCQLLLVVVGFAVLTFLVLKRTPASIYPFLILPFSPLVAIGVALVLVVIFRSRAAIASLLLLAIAALGTLLLPQVATSIRARPFEPMLVIAALAAGLGRFDKIWRFSA